MKLEIGCGPIKKKEEGTIYLDIQPFKDIDIVRDIDKGLPFDDNRFDIIKAHHILEHVNDLIFVMNEIHRCLKPNGLADLEVPSGRNASIDPTHKRIFNQYSFNFFIVKDFNSMNAGVEGWFDVVEISGKGPSDKDIRGINVQLRKK